MRPDKVMEITKHRIRKIRYGNAIGKATVSGRRQNREGDKIGRATLQRSHAGIA
jgi:hypothetical protein